MKIPIIDTHTDLINSYLEFGSDELFQKVKKQVTIPKLKNSGTKLFFASFSYDDELGNTHEQLNLYEKLFVENKIGIVNSSKDLDKFPNHPQALFHIEGGDLIKETGDVYKLFENGVRSLGLAYSKVNSLSYGEKSEIDPGLTKLGKDIVKIAGKIGIVVDLAHTGEKSFQDAVSIVRSPAIVSHTACRSLCNSPRNISDSQIKEIAKVGGTVGIFFAARFVSDKKKVTIKDVIKHFIYIANLVGTKYISIGSDFGGISQSTPLGLKSVADFRNLLVELRDKGFSQSEVEDICYRNVLRVLSQTLP